MDIGMIHPIFVVSDNNKAIIEEIEKKLSLVKMDDSLKGQNLKTKSKVRSIHSSLAIEANSLSLQAVTDIIDNKLTLGKRNEIQEVKNAIELYKNMKEYNWKCESDFLRAHVVMMKYFEDDNGHYRNHGEAVQKDNQIIFVAPQSVLVPSLMESLFKFLVDNDDAIHPFVLAAIFHYYLVYIHPFSDGNGRMARFWVSLILTSYNPNFEYIPIEEEIYLNQQEYYEAISMCHNNGNCNVFIDFMLKIIHNSVMKTTQETTQEIKLNSNQKKILEFIKNNPSITRNQLSDKLNITSDGVKYHLNKLVKNGFITRIGSTKGGYWKIARDVKLYD